MCDNWLPYSVGDTVQIKGSDIKGTIIEVDESEQVYKVDIEGTVYIYEEDEVM